METVFMNGMNAGFTEFASFLTTTAIYLKFGLVILGVLLVIKVIQGAREA